MYASKKIWMTSMRVDCPVSQCQLSLYDDYVSYLRGRRRRRSHRIYLPCARTPILIQIVVVREFPTLSEAVVVFCFAVVYLFEKTKRKRERRRKDNARGKSRHPLKCAQKPISIISAFSSVLSTLFPLASVSVTLLRSRCMYIHGPWPSN